jgi:hypothetical protein
MVFYVKYTKTDIIYVFYCYIVIYLCYCTMLFCYCLCSQVHNS